MGIPTMPNMGLARAFTKRLVRPMSPNGSETATVKSVRPTISMPMGLISTTNQSVHDNPTISASHVKAIQDRQISLSSESSSVDDSVASGSCTPDTPCMTDTSSVESYSPVEPNHLSQYFPPAFKPVVKPATLSSLPESEQAPEPTLEEAQAQTSTTYSCSSETSSASAPVLPKRAPSHSKREHERLSRMRSFTRSSNGMLSPKASFQSIVADLSDINEAPILPLKSPSRPSSATASSRPTSDEQDKSRSPFSNELMQLQEVAEEFASIASPLHPHERSSVELEREAAEAEEDERIMQEKGLKSHRLSEYLRDISSLRSALWDPSDTKDEDEDDDREQFHDAVSTWI